MKKQQGAVSIFVVIFAMLLFAAVSVGFTVLMLRDQDRAVDNDLSQSALDSAKAGVEDAKRTLAKYNDCINRGNDCTQLMQNIENGSCDTVSNAIGVGGEVRVKQNAEDEQLEQAYTCVKVQPKTVDVVKTIRHEGDMKIVPLKGEKSFNSVEVSWVKTGDEALDLRESSKETELGSEHNSSDPLVKQLPKDEKWKKPEWGSILRVQAISHGAGAVNIHDIDSNARTAFLYPQQTGLTAVDMQNDKHRPLPLEGDPEGNGLRDSDNIPRGVKCNPTPSDEYACKVQLTNVKTGGDLAYLTVAGVYGGEDGVEFRVRLLDAAGKPVLFDGVQPQIDATGRANDVFRRIQVRVETADSLEDAMPLPRAALGARGEICKAYTITDRAEKTEYQSGSCETTQLNPTKQPASAQQADTWAGESSSSTPPSGGTGGGTGGGGDASTPGTDTSLAPYTVSIGGKEYRVTPRKITKCEGGFFGLGCKNVTYIEHVYMAKETKCTGLPWNRKCSEVDVEKIYKTVRA